MKKIIKLTESDLVNIVRRVIKEQETESQNALQGVNVDAYCKVKGVPPMVTKILNALPKTLKKQAVDFIKKFGKLVSGKSVKDLIALRKQVKTEMQKAKSQNLSEQLAPIIIGGLVISPSLLIGIGVILLVIIIYSIINNSGGHKGGSCNPGWWDDLNAG